jgi:hypothetical protein
MLREICRLLATGRDKNSYTTDMSIRGLLSSFLSCEVLLRDVFAKRDVVLCGCNHAVLCLSENKFEAVLRVVL